MYFSMTHGHRARQFVWFFRNDHLVIETERDLTHSFSIQEICRILRVIYAEFRDQWFPLANNVEKMYHEQEVRGLGSIIYAQKPGDTLHAQGASYLGVVLEEIGLLEWNGKARGIAWRLRTSPPYVTVLRDRIVKEARERARRRPT